MGGCASREEVDTYTKGPVKVVYLAPPVQPADKSAPRTSAEGPSPVEASKFPKPSELPPPHRIMEDKDSAATVPDTSPGHDLRHLFDFPLDFPLTHSPEQPPQPTESAMTPLSASTTQQPLQYLHPCEGLLQDLKLLSITGTGGYGCVMHGIWRSTTQVAVKFILTSMEQQCTESDKKMQHLAHDSFGSVPKPAPPVEIPALPGRVLTEAILARNLSHPNVVRTFDVRSCQLSGAFVAAAMSGSGGTILSSASSNPSQPSYNTGLTPLRAERSMIDPFNADTMSGDGFGDLMADTTNKPGISWYELLTRLHAKAGDFLTVVIMQFAKLGTVTQAVQKGIFEVKINMDETEKRRKRRALIRTALEIAAGLEHLHALKVVHGDMKPGNCLLDESRMDVRGFIAMVADFGLSQMATPMSLGPHFGTAQYMAPEVFLYGKGSYPSDLYAFGVLVWEMVTGANAFENMSMPQIVMAVGSQGLRPHDFSPGFEQLATPGLVDIYYRCVHQEPEARPTAAQVVSELAALEKGARTEAQAEKRAAKQMAQGGFPRSES